MKGKKVAFKINASMLGVVASLALSGTSFAETSAPAGKIEFPGNIVLLKEKPDGSMFVGYESADRKNCLSTHCFGFGIINKDNSVKHSEWLPVRSQLDAKLTFLMDNTGDFYTSMHGSKEILKLSDPAVKPQVVFKITSQENKTRDSREEDFLGVKNFIFNNDFSQMYVELQHQSMFEHGFAAVDLKKDNYPVIWNESAWRANSVLFNPDSKELIYQGTDEMVLPSTWATIMSAVDGRWYSTDYVLFTGHQSVQASEGSDNFAYGLNLEDCKVTKMKLIKGWTGEGVWTNEVNGCDADITQGEKKTISLNSFDNFVYAGYGNVITIFERDNGNKKVDIIPPLGKFYGDIKFSNNTQMAYRMFTDGSEYGVLEFDSNGQTRNYPVSEKTGDFVIYGNHLYTGEGKNVVKYKLGT